MRALSPALADHLSGGITTLCHCWRLARTDGVCVGFTDHDRPLAFEGMTFEPMQGLSATSDVTKVGLSVGGFEVFGALSAAGLEAEALAAGSYDFAVVDLWLVNWAAVAERVLLRTGTLGEVTREDGTFKAEVRGPAAALETVRGRVFSRFCDADLGDARCRKDLAPLMRAAMVAAVEGRRVRLPADGLTPAGHFTDGLLRVTDGAGAGAQRLVVAHQVFGVEAEVVLRDTVPGLSAGDAVRLSPGCDKRFKTCRAVFDNAVNFQGFPHMPGNDRAFRVAKRGR